MVKAIQLAVSGAFHSPFMNTASEKIRTYLSGKELSAMSLPVYSNATAKVYDNFKELLANQVNHPVLWQQTVENMILDGFDTFIEVGAGKTLSGLIKKINSDIKLLNVSDMASLLNTILEVKNA